MTVNPPPIQYLNLGDRRKLAYRQTFGYVQPGFIFCPGYVGNMDDKIPQAIEKYCIENGHSFVRFDYEGNGSSPGRLHEMNLEVWQENALAVLDELTEGPQIIIGWSMGSWMAFHVAMRRPKRIHGLIGVSTDLNFTEGVYAGASAEAKTLMNSGKMAKVVIQRGTYFVSKKILDSGYRMRIPLDQPIPIRCPVRLYHGSKDTVGSWETCMKIVQKLESSDVSLMILKNADHAMNEPHQIQRLIEVVDNFMNESGKCNGYMNGV